MRVIVRSSEANLWLPIPLALASAAVSLLPRSAIEEMRRAFPPPYDEAVDKAFLKEIVRACRSVLKEYKGLEIVHVEAQDGVFVSIRL